MKKDKQNTMEENVNDIIKNSMEQLKNIVDANTVVGSPITLPENITVLPISKINVGFVAGGGEMKCNLKKIKGSEYPFTGGSGSGFNVSPVGFLIINNSEVSYINIENTAAFKDIFKLTDKIVSKILNDKKEKDDE